MRENSRRSNALASRSAGCASLLLVCFAASPLLAQAYPAIGLSPVFAQRHVETGTQHHAPGFGDRFGAAVAVGDFNQDGFDDVAMGAPGNPCLGVGVGCGSVQVRFGWPVNGLSVLRTLVPGVHALDSARDSEGYGSGLAAGDFDGDGYDDLAVGVPLDKYLLNGVDRTIGSVHIHRGLPDPATRIEQVPSDLLRPVAGSGIPPNHNDATQWGRVLAAGDFDGDGRDELVVSSPYRPVPGGGAELPLGGAVTVITRNDAGDIDGYLMFLGATGGLPGRPQDFDLFGMALATGDFNGDSFDDLAIGIPGDDDARGSVLVVYGSPFSLIYPNHQWFTQGSFGEPSEPGDRFGAALAAGDLDADGFDDLAMGAPGESFENAGRLEVGLVIVASGDASGLLTTNAPWLSEDGIFGSGSEGFDQFGAALAWGDFNRDNYADLAIGVPFEDGSGPASGDQGGVVVVMGRSAGLVGSTARRLAPEHPAGMIPITAGQSELNAQHGTVLASGDFDGNGFADLVVGGPARPFEDAMDAGAVSVIFGQLFIDGFESANASEWSSSR